MELHETTRFLCIDIGTSSIKAAIFCEDGHAIAEVSVLMPEVSPLTLSTQLPTRTRAHTHTHIPQTNGLHTPTAWKCALEHIITQCKNDFAPCETYQCAIIISGHGPSTVYLDAHHNPIYYIAWNSGKKISVPQEISYFAPQIEYLRQQHPDIFSATNHILAPAEYLSYLLTGLCCTFVPYAALAPYMLHEHMRSGLSTTHSSTNCTIQTALSEKNILKDKIAPPLASGSLLGMADTAYARSLKISHCKVIAGGIDFQSAMLGAKIAISSTRAQTRPIKILQRSGTSVVLNINISKAVYEKHKNTLLSKNYFVIPSHIDAHYNIGLTVPLYNALYQEALSHSDIFNTEKAHKTNTSYKIITQKLQHAHAQYAQHLNALVAENINHEEMSTLCKKLRSVMPESCYGEALLYIQLHSLRHCAEQLSTLVCSDMLPLVVSGGHAYNDVLMQMQMEVLGTNVEVLNPRHAELYGNFLYGLKGLSLMTKIEQ